MPALEDLIRGELLDAAEQGKPDMTPREVEVLTLRLARTLRPLVIAEPRNVDASRKQRARSDRPTDRQLQALLLLADSAGSKSMCGAMRISRSTLHDHFRRLASGWGVVMSPVALVGAGFERGWLPLPEVRPVVEVGSRELTLLGLIAADRASEAEDVLGCSTARVVALRAELLRVLGAGSDAGLVAAGWRAGLLPIAPVAAVAS